MSPARSTANMPSVGISVAQDAVVKFTNEALIKIVGYERHELVGKPFAEFMHPHDRDMVVDRYQRRMVGEDLPDQYVYRLVSKDGRTVWVDIKVVVIDWQGRPATLSFMNDITDSYAAQKAVQDSERRYRNLFDSVSDVIYTQDLEGRFITVNRALAQTMGYSKEEIIGTRGGDYMKPQFKKAFDSEYLAKIKQRGHHEGISLYFDRNGGRHYLEYKSFMVEPEDGEPYISGVGREVTERLLAERKLKDLQNQLVQAQKMEAIGTLAGGIAHDFNNILAAMLGYAELSSHDIDDDHPSQASLKEVVKAGQRAKALVRQILSFSRSTESVKQPTISRSTESVKQPTILAPVLNEALKLLRASLPTTIEMKQSIATNGMVRADPVQIHQLLINLCTNAAQAMEGSTGELEIKLEEVRVDSAQASANPDLVEGTYQRILVADTGPGIDPQIIDRIFDPFFTTKEVGEGTGLGLSVVHGIVKEHGGVITVSSQPGEGAVFSVYLPTLESEPQDSPAPDSRPVYGRGETILLVDDEPALAEIGQHSLNHLGYQVEAFTSAEEALAAFSDEPNKYDLVVTDYTMPKMTGEELARRMLQVRPDTPIIITTGFSQKLSEKDLEAMGVKRLVLKPMVARQAAQIIREVLDSGD